MCRKAIDQRDAGGAPQSPILSSSRLAEKEGRIGGAESGRETRLSRVAAPSDFQVGPAGSQLVASWWPALPEAVVRA